ncbi:hypothetical protein [Streptomyces nojiriensis]|uniref:hypothetical protein n=1 Tax=Streptomyces nojiriensis TaxID=66374 RepID=UPI003668A48C
MTVHDVARRLPALADLRGYVRGFGHESAMNPDCNDGEPWPGVVDEAPEVFRPFVEESAFTVDLAAVSDVYALRPLDQELVSSLNAEVTLADLAQDISGIGYPQPARRPI